MELETNVGIGPKVKVDPQQSNKDDQILYNIIQKMRLTSILRRQAHYWCLESAENGETLSTSEKMSKTNMKTVTEKLHLNLKHSKLFKL